MKNQEINKERLAQWQSSLYYEDVPHTPESDQEHPSIPGSKVVPIQQLIDDNLPSVPSNELDQLFERLNQRDDWSNFPSSAHSTITSRPRNETAIAHLQRLYGQVMGEIGQIGQSHSSLEASPENLIKAYGRRHRRLTLATPDAGLILSDGTRHHAELDMENRNTLLMYLPIVFKPGTSIFERQTNSESKASGKIARTMWRIMNDDPRRRFVFGLAFDNAIARLYFTSRTKALVSTPFEMYKDWHILVRIFVALGKAQDRADLGYDDTISVVQDERGCRVFDVSMDNAMFRIANSLSYGSPDATRMWAVREVREGKAAGPYLRLKDHWPPYPRPPEHENIQRLKDLLQGDTRCVHLPGVRAAEFVPRSRDRTQIAMDITENPSTPHTEHVTQSKSTWQGGASCLRAQYRIVYEEMGISMADVKTLDTALSGLQGALCGRIEALHEVGWLHRNINPRSILLVHRDSDHRCSKSQCEPNGHVAVLINFEHAIEDNDDKDHNDFRTNTWQFMASEVMTTYWNLSPDP
ncbi:hypothetical protein MPER_10791, partial [Moniliophthora perniciosa FA553]